MVCPSSSNINTNGFSIRSGFSVEPPPAPTFNSLRRRPLIATSLSMIVARRREGLGDALVLHGRFEHHAVGELVHHRALDFLPWRLALGKLEAAAVLQGKPALREFGFRDQDVGRTFVKVDTDTVTRSQQRKAAARRRFRR